MKTSMKALILTAFALFCANVFAAAPDHRLYNVTKRVNIGQPDWWDYITYDGETGRVYIAHADRISVVDGKSGKTLGEVQGIPGGTHGIVISHATNTGYTDDGRAGQVVAFDPASLQVIGTVKAQDDADGLVLDPSSGHLFAVDGDVGKLSVIDPATNRTIATIDGGGKLEFAVVDGKGNLYVNGAGKRELIHIDTASNKVLAHWSIPMCESPHGLAMDPGNQRLFVSCVNNTLVVLDAANGHVVAQLPIGSYTDGVAFDPIRHRALSANGDGTITVIEERTPNDFAVIDTIKTQMGARTISIDPASGRLFTVGAKYTINKNAAHDDVRHRYQVTPGSATLLFLDPTT